MQYRSTLKPDGTKMHLGEMLQVGWADTVALAPQPELSLPLPLPLPLPSPFLLLFQVFDAHNSSCSSTRRAEHGAVQAFMKKNFIHAQMWQEDTFRPSVFDSEEIQGSTSIRAPSRARAPARPPVPDERKVNRIACQVDTTVRRCERLDLTELHCACSHSGEAPRGAEKPARLPGARLAPESTISKA